MNSDKDIKKFLEETDDLVVPESITKGIDATLNQLKKKKRKKVQKPFIAAAMIVILLGVSVYKGDAVGATIYKVVDNMEYFLKYTLKGASLSDYKTVVGTTAQDKGIKVTLNDFFMEEDRVYINTSIDSKGIEDYAKYIHPILYINGKKVKLSGSTGGGRGFEKEGDKVVNYGEIDRRNKENHSLLIYNVDSAETVDLKNAKNIKIDFNYVTAMKKEYLNKPYNMKIKASEMVRDIKGKWDFEFSYNGEKVSQDIKEYKVEKFIDVEHLKIHVKSVKITPTSVTVKFKDLGEHAKGQPFFVVENEDGSINEMSLYQPSNYDYGYFDNRIDMSTKGLKNIKIVPYINKHLEKRYFKDKGITIDLK